MERTASCLCGQLSITVDGDPVRVNMCSCVHCQRRSGSAFQLGAFFENSQLVGISGEANVYTRASDSGNTTDLNFCPSCGVSVYFSSKARPTLLGVHGGCFADPDFPIPDTAGWTQSKHDWVAIPESTKPFDKQPG